MTYRLRDFGSYTVGGREHRVTGGEPCEVKFTRHASYIYDPRGHFAVEHAYVQYYVPEHRNSAPPVILVHGGGMHGSTWETTPDGRPGWINLLVAQGYEVHVIDNVERGRSGFAPGLWDGTPVLRSQEEAWSLFRIGPADGFASRRPFDPGLFPAEAFANLARSLVPRWFTTTPLHVSALVALLHRIGPATVICHSQGGEITFDAQAQVPGLVAGIVALEPSGLPASLEPLVQTPLCLCFGDHLDVSEQWLKLEAAWTTLIDGLQRLGALAIQCSPGKGLGAGNSHMLMMDRNNADVLAAVMDRYMAVSAAARG